MLRILLVIALLFAPAASFSQDKLLFALDLIRHGERTPINDIATAPGTWPVGPGQLTPRGMHQEYDLGASMRAEYIERYSLLPKTYTAGTLYVRSSDIDRTLQSAQCVMLGLYPPGTGPVADGAPAIPALVQPVPIHTVSEKAEPILFPDTVRHDLDTLITKYARHSARWQEKDAALRPNFARWAKITGRPVDGLDALIGLEDALYIRSLYKIPPPAGLSEDEIKTIIDAGSWTFAERFRPAETGEGGLALLRAVAAYISAAADGKTGPKYVLFSAHDTTVLAQMSALGAPLTKAPPFASRVNFELFETSSGKVVKVKFNGTPVHVKGCAEDFCTLAQFMSLAK